MATQAHIEANKRYLAKQGEIKLRMSKERKAAIQAHAAAHGKSLNAFVNEAIDEKMGKK